MNEAANLTIMAYLHISTGGGAYEGTGLPDLSDLQGVGQVHESLLHGYHWWYQSQGRYLKTRRDGYVYVKMSVLMSGCVCAHA